MGGGPPRLDEALAGLGAAQRNVVLLRHVHGKSEAEAAAELGWSRSRTSVTLSRAMSALRERLARRGADVPTVALGALLAGNAGSSGAPATLLSSIQSACLGKAAASAAATEIGEGIMRAMLWARIEATSVVLGSLAAVALLGGLLAGHLLAAEGTAVPAAPANAPGIEKIGESVIDPNALVYTKDRWGTCPNGKSHQLDAMATHAGWQYATWWDAKRRLAVGRRKLPAGEWETVHFDDYLHKREDTHNTTQLGVCAKDGTIHLAFDHHGDPLHYRVSKKGVATRPGETKWAADLFGPVTSKLNPGGKPEGGVTYPTFCLAPDGNVFLLWRRGGSGNGDWHLAEYDGGTGAWKSLGVIVSGKGDYKGSSSRCAYPNGLDFDAGGRLHLTWCWRESANPMSNHDLCYAYSDDRGRTWFNSAGAKAGKAGPEPIRAGTPGIAAVEIPTGRGLINSTGQAVDGKGCIHVVTWHLPADAPATKDWEGASAARHYFHYWREMDGKWRADDIAPKVVLGARPKLRFDAKNNLYLVFRAGGIAAATAGEEWKDWKVVHTEPGGFLSEPSVDFCRWRDEGVLSLCAQRRPDKPGSPSPLCTLDFRPAP